MRRTLLALLLASAAPCALAADLDLKRVVLSQGGVGYFEFEAQVTGDAELSLPLRREQVDDVLKSIVVYDDQGGIGGVRLPGEEPLSQAFRDLPVQPDDLGSLPQLLSALQGAEVTVAGPRPLAGRVVAVAAETAALPNGGTVTQHRLSLLTAAGLQQTVLESADGIAFVDAGLQARLGRALAAVAANRNADRRVLTVQSRGTAARTLRVGYMVETPLWKTSYRLTLPADPAAPKGRLQGWAVLENLSGQDWRDVELTLVSGNPVTFRQALYRAYFVDRPEVPVEVLGRVLPNLDRGSLPAPEEALRPAPTAVPAPAPAMAPPPPGGAMRKAAPSAQALMEQMAAPPQAGGAVPVESAEAATQVTFRFGQKVSVQAGQSFVVPVVDRDVPAERLALYQPGTQPLHPLAATRLVNDGATGLPPGVLTLYERGTDGAVGFVGDARMGVVERGESRLLSFAVDTRTRIDREEGRTLRHTQAVASQGVMILTRMESQSFTHRLKAPQGEARRVVLEVPRWEGWTLRLPAGMTAELAPDAHRVTVDLAPGESREVVLTLERPEEEAIGLGDLGAPDIQAYAESDELPQAARDALMRLAELRRDVEARRRDLTALEGRRAILYAEQERLRQNLAAAPGESDLHRRYLAKLGEQETEIETVQRDAQAAQTALAEAEAAFERGVAALRF